MLTHDEVLRAVNSVYRLTSSEFDGVIWKLAGSITLQYALSLPAFHLLCLSTYAKAKNRCVNPSVLIWLGVTLLQALERTLL